METQLTSRIDIFLQVVDKERIFGVCLKTVDQDPVNLFFGFNQFFVSRDDLALEIPPVLSGSHKIPGTYWKGRINGNLYRPTL